MRKQTKLVAVLSAAALLAIGASMTSFAATPHWDQQDGEWVYLDRNGDRVTDEWKKSNGQWYYLDENGYMARETVVEDDDDKYYVDSSGARVTNAWVSMDNDDLLDDDDESDNIDTVWMYFDGTGKALGCDTTNGEIKRLPYGDGQSAYFIFNEDGYMLSGWKKWTKDGANDKLYYLGGQNEGWAHTGWQYLEIDPDIDAFAGINEDAEEYEDEAYFYFRQNGKAYVDEDTSIGGKTYIFDEYGRMLDLWVYPTGSDSDSGYTNENASSSDANSAFYLEDNGGREKNWVFAYPNTSYDNYSDDPYWFYLDSKGKPFRADKKAVDDNKLTAIGTSYRIDDDNVTDSSDSEYNGAVAAKSIKSETYLFNDKGVMLTGLYWLGGSEAYDDSAIDQVCKGTSGPMDNGLYYFTIDGDHSSLEGQMVSNKKVKIEVDGEDETYYFKKNGAAHRSAIISGYVYGWDGKQVTAYGDGSTYQCVDISLIALKYEDVVPGGTDSRYVGKYVLVDKSGNVEFAGEEGDEILINENGKIRKSGTITDVNDQKVKAEGYLVIPESKRDDD